MGAGGNEGAGEGAVPGERVRKMEIKANEAFDVYRELYYEGGVSSVYFWNLDDGFAGVVLLKKCEFGPFFSLAGGSRFRARPADMVWHHYSFPPGRQQPRRLGFDPRI